MECGWWVGGEKKKGRELPGKMDRRGGRGANRHREERRGEDQSDLDSEQERQREGGMEGVR